MYVVYRVPRGVECEELEIMGARAGDHVVVRPAHPTAPLALARHFDRNAMPLILSASDHLELLETPRSPADPRELLRAAVGHPGFPRLPHLRLMP